MREALMTAIRHVLRLSGGGNVELTPEAERRAALDRLMDQRIRLAKIDATVDARRQEPRHGVR